MDCFEFLGISPTKDEKEIKRAYSNKLPLYSPETDPEGFQSLREAYKEAIKKVKEDDEEVSISSVDQFMKSFEDTYKNFKKRIDEDGWKQLLETDVCFNIDTGKEISNRILAFMMDNYYFPQNIWALFNSYFSWNTKEDKLYDEFPKNFIDFVVYKINNDDYFRYNCLLSCADGKQDEFITNYNNGCRALDDYDLYSVNKALLILEEICPIHPDFLILSARYKIVNGKIEEAKELLTKIINDNNNDFYAHYYRGNLFFRIGKLQEAYNDYKIAVDIDKDFVDLLLSLGKCCISLGEYEEAIKHLNKAGDSLQYNREVNKLISSANNFQVEYLKEIFETNNEDIDIKYKLSEAQYSAGNFEDSYNMLSEMEQQGQFDNKMYSLFCKVLFELEKNELAYATISKGLELFPGDYDLICWMAYVLDNFKKYDEAVTWYDKAIDINPSDALNYNNKAYALNRLQKYNEALEAAEKSITIDSNMAHAYKNKAEALLELGLYQECLDACDTALSIYEYLVDVYIIKMKLLRIVNQDQEALNIFSKAIEYGLKDSRLYSEKANILRLSEKYDEAIDCCEQAIELDENNQEAYYFKGLSYYCKESYIEAISCLDLAIERDENYENAYYYKILSLLYDSKEEEGLKELDKVINLNTPNVDRFYELKGDVFAHNDKHEEAIAQYKNAIEKDSTQASYYYAVGRQLNNLSKFKESLPFLDKAIELDPSSADAYIDKSHSLYNLDEFTKCVEQCDIALGIAPDSLVANQNKAWAFYKLNDISGAEEFCNSGLKIDGNHVNLLYLKLKILKEKGLIKEALVVSDRILDIDPDDEDTIKIREELFNMDKPKKGFLGLFSK